MFSVFHAGRGRERSYIILLSVDNILGAGEAVPSAPYPGGGGGAPEYPTAAHAGGPYQYQTAYQQGPPDVAGATAPPYPP